MTAYTQKCCGFPLMMGSIQSGDLFEGSTTQSKLSESEMGCSSSQTQFTILSSPSVMALPDLCLRGCWISCLLIPESSAFRNYDLHFLASYPTYVQNLRTVFRGRLIV